MFIGRIFLSFFICCSFLIICNTASANHVLLPFEASFSHEKSGVHKMPASSQQTRNCVSDSSDSSRLEKKAIWSKRLGIGSLIGLLIPGINILSLPAAIIAIVLGTSSIKKVKNKKNARQGITFGIITTAIAVVVIGIVVLIVSVAGVK